MTEAEIAAIDKAFVAGQDGEESGYAQTIQKCVPLSNGGSNELRAFFFSDGCMSTFTFGFEVLRLRDEHYPRVVDQEIKTAGKTIGLLKNHVTQTSRHDRMLQWLSSTHASEDWTTSKKLHIRSLTRAAKRGITWLGREFLEQFEHSGMLQDLVPFNLRGHYALRRNEHIPRSLLLLERARQHREQHFNFYGTFATADVYDFKANTDGKLHTLLAFGELLARVSSFSSDQYDYERRLADLVAASGHWSSLTEAVSRGPMPLSYTGSSQIGNFDRYHHLLEAVEERPLTREEQSEFTLLEKEIFSAMNSAQRAFFEGIERDISQADSYRRKVLKLVQEITGSK